MNEYVRFLGPESLYWYKHFLHSELEILDIVKRIKNYQRLRREEHILRIALKKKINESIEALNILDKLLPHARFHGLMKKNKAEEEIIEDKEALSLDQELEQIRNKIERLQAN